MRRFRVATFVFAFASLLVGARAAQAQVDAGERNWEAGFQFSAFNVTNGEVTPPTIPCLGPFCPLVVTGPDRRTEPGFGGRVGYSFNRHLTAEAEVNLFPQERELAARDFSGGRKLQGLFGVKVGRRFEHVSVFAKARPGFVRFAEGDLRFRSDGGCIAIDPPPLACFESHARTDFAVDLGGVLELYPSSRVFVRLDAGDTILRTDEHLVPALFQPTPTGPIPVFRAARDTTHNFQASVGVGFRF